MQRKQTAMSLWRERQQLQELVSTTLVSGLVVEARECYGELVSCHRMSLQLMARDGD